MRYIITYAVAISVVICVVLGCASPRPRKVNPWLTSAKKALLDKYERELEEAIDKMQNNTIAP